MAIDIESREKIELCDKCKGTGKIEVEEDDDDDEDKIKEPHYSTYTQIHLFSFKLTACCLILMLYSPRNLLGRVNWILNLEPKNMGRTDTYEDEWGHQEGLPLFYFIFLLSLWSLSVSLKEWGRQKRKMWLYKPYFVTSALVTLVFFSFAIYLFYQIFLLFTQKYSLRPLSENPDTFIVYLLGFFIFTILGCLTLTFAIYGVLIEKRQEEEKALAIGSFKGTTHPSEESKMIEKIRREKEEQEKIRAYESLMLNAELIMHFMPFIFTIIFIAIVFVVTNIQHEPVVAILFLCSLCSLWNFSIALMVKGRKEKRLCFYWPYFVMTILAFVLNGILVIAIPVTIVTTISDLFENGVYLSSRWYENVLGHIALFFLPIPLEYIIWRSGLGVIKSDFWRLFKEKSGHF